MTEDSNMQRMTEAGDEYFADALTNMQPHCEDLVSRLTDTIRGKAVPRVEEALISPFDGSYAANNFIQQLERTSEGPQDDATLQARLRALLKDQKLVDSLSEDVQGFVVHFHKCMQTYSLESRRQNKNNLDRHFGNKEPEDEISLTTCGLVDPPFSENEVKLTVFKFGKRKSPGPEGIDNTVVKALEELPEGARLVLYANDQFLIIEAASRAKAEKCVETSLQILSIWAHDSGLKFNVSKTKALSFKPRDIRTKRKGIKWEHKPAIRMEGRRVALVNRMTILGVVIDDKMGWQYQAEEMVAGGREALCRPVLVGSHQGGGEKEAELVAIRVALRVCAEKNFSPDRLYSDCMSALVAINLEKGQLAHQIIQELEMMTRAPVLPWFRSHSLIEGNEFADRIAKAGCFRDRSLRTPVTKKEVYRRIRGQVQDLWLDRWRNSVKGRKVFNGVTTPKYLCKVMSHKLIRTVRDMGSSPSLHRFKIKRNPDCVYGERDVNARHYVLDCPRVVGVQEERRRARGAIESKLLRNHSKLLEKAHDVAAELFLSSELVAIRVALRVCAEKNFSPDRLYSDCMSALVAINLEKGQLAHQIIQELEMMTRAPVLPWFRSHSLIEGNEFADRIAKAGCFRDRSLRTPVTKKEVYRRIRGQVQDLWLDRWRNSVKGRKVFNGVTTPKYLCKVMSHKLIRTVRDMGSSPSLHRFKIKRNPDCVYGERDVNARHYVLDCPRVVGVQEERRRARGAIESKLLRNHSKLLEKAHDVAAELFLSLIVAVYACGVDVEKGPIRQQLWNAPPCDNVESCDPEEVFTYDGDGAATHFFQH
ncbi:hypothetical protein LAZ67_20001403 [Cordylochernes scorpioides]|uniref:RNase H type-1 domain-containing protein n=1 Tax=Cordylochernes scorpioides TaxID=51811 RepID=A0ABY6LMU0_9ARAC|nr:hypothetical protein LAZ67_20001403 [Cordylochernes scorpioides]